jgi:ATP-binding cassette subfamily C protein CydC
MKYWFQVIFAAEKKRIYIGVLLAFITAISGVALLLLSGWFITATSLVGISLALGSIIIFDMYMPGSGIRFFALSRTVSRYVERLYNHNTILKLVAVFRGELFGRLMQSNYGNHSHKDDKEWLNRLTADLDALDSILLRYTITPIAVILVGISVLIFSYFTWHKSTVLIFALLMISIAYGIFGTVFLTTKNAYESAKLQSSLRTKSIEHLQGSLELHCKGLQTIHAKPLQKDLKILFEIESKLRKSLSRIQFLLDVYLHLGLVSVILLMLNNVNEGTISGPVAVLIILMTIGVIEVVQMLPAQFKEWGKTKYSAKKLEREFSQTTCHSAMSCFTHSELEQLSIRINKHPSIPALKDGLVVSLEQKYTIFVGRSGAGKSTLANLIAGSISANELEHNQVQYLLNGELLRDIKRFDSKDLFYLQQGSNVFSDSIRYNLSLGLQGVSDADLLVALKHVELADWIETLPKGLDTWLGDTGERLSGGQAQRLCLARVFLRQPKLVILDEPFNGVDRDTANKINFALLKYLHNSNVMIFIHETSGFFTEENEPQVVNLNLE